MSNESRALFKETPANQDIRLLDHDFTLNLAISEANVLAAFHICKDDYVYQYSLYR